MRPKRVDHVGIAVRDLDEAKAFLQETLGLDLTHEEVVEDQGVTTYLYPVAGVKLELLESLDPEGPIARFLDDRGPGMHHLAVEVDDVERAIAHMRERGVRMIDETPRPGVEGTRIAFCHPKDTHGILLELVEFPGHIPEEPDVLGG